MENVSSVIFGDGCVGPNCMDRTGARPITKRRVRNLKFLSIDGIRQSKIFESC